jgi:anti-sigma factor RsiW
MESIKEGSHISPDMLAEYALGRLPRRDAPVVFEHLLVCEECNERYEEEFAFRKQLDAAAALNAKAAHSEAKSDWRSWLLIPKPAWAAAAALAVIAFFAPVLRQGSSVSPTQVVDLTAMRGEQATVVDSGSTLELRLDRTRLQAPEQVRVQIVSESGADVWAGTATATGDRWVVRPERLEPGQYWVRVYNPNGGSEPLREFALQLR